MANKRGRPNIHLLSEMRDVPTLWVAKDDARPVAEFYFSDVQRAITHASWAAALGLDFRLDVYHGPINDTTDQHEAHLVVWREVRADASMSPREKVDA